MAAAAEIRAPEANDHVLGIKRVVHLPVPHVILMPARGTGQHRVVGSDALIAPVIAWGNDAASAKRPEASGDASLQLPVNGAGEKPPLTPRRGLRGGGPSQGGGGVLLK